MQKNTTILISLCLFAATAEAKPSRGVSVNVWDELSLKMDGTKLTQGKKLFAGQIVSCDLSSNQAGPPQAGVTWNIGGILVKEFAPNASNGYASIITKSNRMPSDNGANSLDFFWADGLPDGKVQYLSSYLQVNGQERSKTSYVMVKKPYGAFTRQQGEVRRGYRYNNQAGIGLTDGPEDHSKPDSASPFYSGIVLTGTSTIPWSKGASTSGKLCFIQTINSTNYVGRKAYISTKGKWYADPNRFTDVVDAEPNKWQYTIVEGDDNDTNGDKRITIMMADSPNQSLGVKLDTQEELPGEPLMIDEHFITFLMYMPPVVNARWVPLRSIGWYWKGNMQYTTGTNGVIDPQSVGADAESVDIEKLFPVWSKHGGNNGWEKIQ